MFSFFLFNDTATTEIYTLSLHDALPISEIRDLAMVGRIEHDGSGRATGVHYHREGHWRFQRARKDRKSTRLNSSHVEISYAVFCLKKKKKPPPHLASPLPPSCLPTTRQT